MKIPETWEDELTIFRQDQPPEKRSYEEYIRFYKETGDDRHFEAFLHAYEKRLNINVLEFIRRYGMQGHFEDLKMVYAEGLLEAARQYDLSYGVPFMFFKEQICRNGLLEYARTMRTGYTVPTESEYKKLRTVMRLFHENGCSYDPAVINRIADKMGMEADKVKKMIDGGRRNEHLADFYRRYPDPDGEEGAEDVTYDNSMNPEKQFFLNYRGETVMTTFEQMSPRQKNVLAARCGFCEYCYTWRKKKEFWKIAEDNNLSSEETVKKIYRQAVKDLKRLIEKSDVMGIFKTCIDRECFDQYIDE